MSRFFILTLGLLVAHLSLAAVSLEAGEQKSAVCAACHSADGNSSLAENPVLAGQHEKYLLKQLQNFKSPDSGRQNAIMTGMVAALTEEDMRNIAAFYASQTPKETASKEAFVALGEAIWRGGIPEKQVPACTGCHGPSGQGNGPASFPKLAGQHSEYTITQLKLFRSGQRANDPNAMMRDVTNRMTDEEMEAVAEYLVGLY